MSSPISRVGGEEADVLVDARRRRVVVAGADVHVAPEPVALAPDDERRLRVDLHVGEAVDDVHAGLLERARPLDVAALVEARLQLDDADDSACRSRTPSIRAGAIAESSLVRYTVVFSATTCGSFAAALHERLDARRERVVRMVDDDVAARDLLEQVVVLRTREPPLGVAAATART